MANENKECASQSLMTRFPSSRPSRRTSCKIIVKSIKKGLFFSSSSLSDEESSLSSSFRKLFPSDELSDSNFTVRSSSSSVSGSSSRRSNLKGSVNVGTSTSSSRHSNHSKTKKQTKQQPQPTKRVKFHRNYRKLTQVHKVEPYFLYTDDLWWKRDELDECRKEQVAWNNDSGDETEHDNFQAFLLSYRNAREEIFPNQAVKYESPSESAQVSMIQSSNKVTCSTYKISDQCYVELVKGYQYGFDGLERYCGYDFNQRRDNITNIVRSTVKYYFMHRYDDGFTPDELANFSKPHTACDRFWACIKGHALADKSSITATMTTTKTSSSSSTVHNNNTLCKTEQGKPKQ